MQEKTLKSSRNVGTLQDKQKKEKKMVEGRMVDWNKLWLDFKAIIPSASLFPPFTGNYLLHRERVVAFRYVVDFLNPGMLHD